VYVKGIGEGSGLLNSVRLIGSLRRERQIERSGYGVWMILLVSRLVWLSSDFKEYNMC
jgi:hypothetical protein